MFYRMSDNCVCGYVFVYDDSDESVEYIDKSILGALNIPDNSIQFYTKSSSVKFKMLGFMKDEVIGGSLVYNFCSYTVGIACVFMWLRVFPENGIYEVIFSFVYADTGNQINLKPTIGFDYYVPANYIEFGTFQKFSRIFFRIPLEMIKYLLNLRSKNDFEGVMRAFGNLFWTDINKVVASLGDATPCCFERWS